METKMTNDQFAELIAVLRAMVDATNYISRGGTSGPLGLEAIGMSIEGAGAPGHNPLSSAIIDAGANVAGSIERLADAMESVASAISSLQQR